MANVLQSLSPEHVRKELRLMLIASISTMNLFVLLVPAHQREIVSDWLVNVCAAAVVLVSAMILSRQRFRGLYGRTYGTVAIGLLLWFSAQVITTYEGYQTTNSLVTTRGPIASSASIGSGPSIGDLIWLVGYAFFAYFLLRIMIHLSKSVKPRNVILIGSVTGIFALILTQSIAYYYNSYQLAESKQEIVADNITSKASLFLHIEYPVLDLMLIVPATVILSSVKNGKLTSTPWILISAALLILAASDIGSIYSSVLKINGSAWVWKMVATAGYLCIATSLFWYNRFFIFDAKRISKAWQESNR